MIITVQLWIGLDWIGETSFSFFSVSMRIERQKRKHTHQPKWNVAHNLSFFIALCFSLSLSFFIGIAVPRLLGKVLDHNAKAASSTTTSSASASASLANNGYDMNYLLLIVLGGGLSSFLRTTMLNRAQDGIASSLRCQLFKSLLIDRDVEWYNLDQDDAPKDNTTSSSSKGDAIVNEKEKSQESSSSSLSSHSPSAIQSILTKDVETVSATITTTMANTFRSTCSIIFATKNMYDINPNLLSMSLSIVPLIGSAAVVLNKFVKKITLKYHALTEQAEEFATERIDHISTVKTSARQCDEVEKYQQMQIGSRALSRYSSLAKGLFMGFMFSSSSSALVLLFHIGGKSVANGRMSFGELKTFATYTFMLGLGTSGLMKGLGSMMQVSEALDYWM